jgi:hypothetical protein
MSFQRLLIAMLAISVCEARGVAAYCGEPGTEVDAGTRGFPAADADGAALEFFERRIRPVLVRNCYECHSTGSVSLKGGLLLDSREGIRRGGDSGPAVVPGSVAESLLVSAIRQESYQMPPAGKLPDDVIADFVAWIESGAADPRDAPPTPSESALQLWEVQLAERRGWWSYQPVRDPIVPSTENTTWSNQPIDRFILARLEAAGLAPAPKAGRVTLARRLSYSLCGMPPSAESVERFVNDDSPTAWEDLVDSLLSSPHFGERWARHWMDVVRYTDTYGYEWDIPAKGAWRYRDYLVRAFNQDIPFDQLIREQLAGDLLPRPRLNHEEQINESLIGTMFYQMGEKRHGDSSEFNGIHQEMLDNKIEAFSKAFQGTTMACARCHDHKIDVVSQRDYYALAGIFMSSRWVTNTIDLPERNAAAMEELRKIKVELRPRLAAQWAADVADLRADLLSACCSDAPAAGPRGAALRKVMSSFTAETPATLEHPLYAWSKAVEAARTSGDVGVAWTAAAAAYREQWEARASDNAAHFTPALDFRQGLPPGWTTDGTGLRELAACGDFTVALAGDGAVGRLLPGGLYTSVLSPRLNGAVRSPYLSLDNRFGHVSIECCGGDFSAVRTVVDNAFLTEKQKYLDRSDPAWELLNTFSNQPQRRVYIEIATKSSNPNFPPRVGLGGACSEEQAADPRSWFGVTRAVFHNAPKLPADELHRFRSLFENAGDPAGAASPATLEQAAARYQGWFASAIAAWQMGSADEGHVRLINWLLDQGLLTNDNRAMNDSAVSELVARYRTVETQLAVPCTVNGMADLDPAYDYPLNVRGDYDQLAAPVPRGYPEVLCRASGSLGPTGSGRLQLAELVASPDNPLTARVFVNRVWLWLFGAGLVATPDDFGGLGGQPSHPELLDWLARRFMADGWSLKRLVRQIVLTSTWRQVSQPSDTGRQTDPANRLLHHFPVRRLEAEEIRDSILAASGRLVPRLGGPPIDPFRPKEDPQKRLFCGPLDGEGRRSLYTKITIMEPPRLLALFNQPTPKIPTGRRDLTNTPAQSLALLNDEFVTSQAEHWAARLIARPDETAAARLQHMFGTALGREATAEELIRWTGAVQDLAALHQVSPGECMTSLVVWKDAAHAVFNLKEFIYIR